MRELYEKMINESMAAQKADVAVISENRYNDFKITDAKPYADAVAGMTALDNQAESVINLHKESVKNHYEILSSITDTLKCDGINVVQNNGEAAGQTVFHFHTHIIPRYGSEKEMVLWKPNEVTSEKLSETCEKLRKAL
jgi:diadenosine tetraphosphate (Ap4A) HIT family hydrolase